MGLILFVRAKKLQFLYNDIKVFINTKGLVVFQLNRLPGCSWL